MARLIWSPQAAADLEEICEYIARDARVYARAFATEINSVVKKIPDHPQAGRVVPEFGDPNIRERIVGSYRVIYRLAPGAIEIVTVIHGSRLLRADGEGG